MRKNRILFTIITVLAVIVISGCSVNTPVSRLVNQGIRSAQAIQRKLQDSQATQVPSTGQDSTNSAKPQAKVQQPAATALPPTGNQSNPGLLSAYEGTLEKIYSDVNPSVVNIQVMESQSQASQLPPGHPVVPQNPTTPGQQLPSVGLGSGFIWDTQGYIVTNNHVVDGATQVTVTFSDGTILDATVVGKDPFSDLAVIKVDAPSDLLKPVTLADSNGVQVGQMAIAIGEPFGEQGTMTVGIISAVGRSIPADLNTSTAQTTPSYTIPSVIQTDAPINPGNSGGVLLNDQGQVIGVTSAIESPVKASVGIGYAIPSNLVQKVVPELISKGTYAHPYLGITGMTLTPDLAKAMGLDPNQRGALVAEVRPGGPAEQAGLTPSTKTVDIQGTQVPVGGDVITAIDGQPVKTIEDVIAYLETSTTVGQQIKLTVLRDGAEQTVQVTLGERPAQTP